MTIKDNFLNMETIVSRDVDTLQIECFKVMYNQIIEQESCFDAI